MGKAALLTWVARCSTAIAIFLHPAGGLSLGTLTASAGFRCCVALQGISDLKKRNWFCGAEDRVRKTALPASIDINKHLKINSRLKIINKQIYSYPFVRIVCRWPSFFHLCSSPSRVAVKQCPPLSTSNPLLPQMLFFYISGSHWKLTDVFPLL